MTDSFMTGKIQTLQERVNLFNQMALPGQPLGMHMGTSYLVNDLARENKRLREKILSWIDMAENCAGLPSNPDSLPQMLLHEMRTSLESSND